MTRGPAAWAVGVAIGLALVLLPLRKWVTEQQVQGSAAAQYGAQLGVTAGVVLCLLVLGTYRATTNTRVGRRGAAACVGLVFIVWLASTPRREVAAWALSPHGTHMLNMLLDIPLLYGPILCTLGALRRVLRRTRQPSRLGALSGAVLVLGYMYFVVGLSVMQTLLRRNTAHWLMGVAFVGEELPCALVTTPTVSLCGTACVNLEWVDTCREHIEILPMAPPRAAFCHVDSHSVVSMGGDSTSEPDCVPFGKSDGLMGAATWLCHARFDKLIHGRKHRNAANMPLSCAVTLPTSHPGHEAGGATWTQRFMLSPHSNVAVAWFADSARAEDNYWRLLQSASQHNDMQGAGITAILHGGGIARSPEQWFLERRTAGLYSAEGSMLHAARYGALVSRIRGRGDTLIEDAAARARNTSMEGDAADRSRAMMLGGAVWLLLSEQDIAKSEDVLTPWLKQVLSRTDNGTAVIVLCHTSPFTDSCSRDVAEAECLATKASARNLRMRYVPLFERYGVSLVLSGQRGDGWAYRRTALRGKTTYISGGCIAGSERLAHAHGEQTGADEGDVTSAMPNYGVIDITNEGEALAWHAFDSVGTEIDRFVIDDQE